MSVWDKKSAAFEWGLETGEKLERERIIKILESIRVGDHWIGRDYAIDLINGSENVSVEIENLSEGENNVFDS